jgi:hypothetical protein
MIAAMIVAITADNRSARPTTDRRGVESQFSRASSLRNGAWSDLTGSCSDASCGRRPKIICPPQHDSWQTFESPVGENPQSELRAGLGLARDRYFYAPAPISVRRAPCHGLLRMRPRFRVALRLQRGPAACRFIVVYNDRRWTAALALIPLRHQPRRGQLQSGRVNVWSSLLAQ